MNPQPLPALLANLDKERRNTYTRHLAFYAGTQWAGRARLGERRLTFNYARVLIDKVAAYVMAENDIHILPAAPSKAAINRANQAETTLRNIADYNHLQALDLDNEIDTSVLGDGAYKVSWDDLAHQVRITSPDVQGLFAWRQPDDPARLLQVASQYQMPTAHHPITVTELWTPTTFELWEDNNQLSSAPNPYGEIPFVLYPNIRRPKSPWGDSDIPAIQETARELNRELSALSQIMELSGNPIAVLENVDKAQDIAVQPGAVWEVPEKARAYLLDLLAGNGVSLHVEYVNLLYRTLHDLAEVPRTAFGDNQRNLSGVALEVELQPLLQRVARKRLVRSAAFHRRAQLALRIHDLIHGSNLAAAGTIATVWGPTVPRDRSRSIEQESALVRAGLSSYTSALTRLGVDNPEAELATWAAERLTVTHATQPPAAP